MNTTAQAYISVFAFQIEKENLENVIKLHLVIPILL